MFWTETVLEEVKPGIPEIDEFENRDESERIALLGNF